MMGLTLLGLTQRIECLALLGLTQRIESLRSGTEHVMLLSATFVRMGRNRRKHPCCSGRSVCV